MSRVLAPPQIKLESEAHDGHTVESQPLLPADVSQAHPHPNPQRPGRVRFLGLTTRIRTNSVRSESHYDVYGDDEGEQDNKNELPDEGDNEVMAATMAPPPLAQHRHLHHLSGKRRGPGSDFGDSQPTSRASSPPMSETSERRMSKAAVL